MTAAAAGESAGLLAPTLALSADDGDRMRGQAAAFGALLPSSRHATSPRRRDDPNLVGLERAAREESAC
jgi:hypothetical protein